MKKIALITLIGFIGNPLAALAEGEVANAKPSENTKTMPVGYSSGELGHANHQNVLYDLIASNPTANSSPRSTSNVNNERSAIASTQSADLPDPPAGSAPLADPNDPNSPPAQPTESQVEKFVREAAEKARKEAERAMANFDTSAPTESGQLPDPPAGVAPTGDPKDPANPPSIKQPETPDQEKPEEKEAADEADPDDQPDPERPGYDKDGFPTFNPRIRNYAGEDGWIRYRDELQDAALEKEKDIVELKKLWKKIDEKIKRIRSGSYPKK